MGGFENVDEAILAGERIEDEDIGSAASINPLKISKRPIYMSVPLAPAILTGAGVVRSTSGVFPQIILPNANAGSFIATSVAPRGEIVPGEVAKLHVFWRKVTAVNGNIRLVLDIAPLIEGLTSTASAVNRAIISVAQAGLTDLQEAIFELPPAIFSNKQLIAIQIARDPANVLDTLASDIGITSIYLEMNGRC